MKNNINKYLIGLSCLFGACDNNAVTGPSDVLHSNVPTMKSTIEKKETVPLDPAAYINWVEDEGNGLKKKNSIGTLNFEIQYKPLEYVVLKEIGTLPIKKEEYEKETEASKGTQYFTFLISSSTKDSKEVLKSGIKEEGEWSKRMEYLNFTMQNDLKLVEGNDTLPCVLYHFERAIGLTPYLTFVLGFEEKNRKNEDKKMIYDDHLFGIGLVQLTLKAENITHIPDLKLE